MSAKWEKIINRSTGETCYRTVHSTGLPIIVCPKQGFRSVYAVFAARYGSIDTSFETDGVVTEVPAGIAHYLEHKLFESEDGDAFSRYAATGASANAYTGFDRTAYLFSCTDNAKQSLEILLDFVQSPYFTQQGVDKERGIIGQEIQMGLDSPERRVLMNLLTALYEKHPVRIDIAGSTDSIAQITPQLLDGCYKSFYNLRNMALVVSGNIDTQTVEAVSDGILKPAPESTLERACFDEPFAAVSRLSESRMAVAAPLVYLGYKDAVKGSSCRSAKQLAAAKVLLELVAGPSSPLYSALMEQGLINESFDVEYFNGPGYACWLFGGETRDPDLLCDAIRTEISRLRRAGIDNGDFEMARAAIYGKQVKELNTVEGCAEMLLDDHFYGRGPFEMVEAAAGLAAGDVAEMLNACLQEEQSAMSVIRPL